MLAVAFLLVMAFSAPPRLMAEGINGNLPSERLHQPARIQPIHWISPAAIDSPNASDYNYTGLYNAYSAENGDVAEILNHSPNRDWTIGADVVLLIDVSGSMRFTDPNRAALAAAADFIDRLPIGLSRVGVIGFSGRIQYHMPLRRLDAEYVRDELRQEIGAFQYVGFTDIGAALFAAAEMLSAEDALTNPMVLLMSDGWIEIGPAQAPRTAADSFADVEIALDILERQMPIFTVGLDHPFGGVDEALLEMIARRSNAYAQFTDNADDLPDLFVQALTIHMAHVLANVPIDTEANDTTEATTTSTISNTNDIETITPPTQEAGNSENIPHGESGQTDTNGDIDTADNEINDAYDSESEYPPLPSNGGNWLTNILYSLATISGLAAAVFVFRLVRLIL